MTKEKLEEYFLNIDEKKFRATQVFEWLYKKRIKSFDEMSNLNKNIIDKLKNDFSIESITILKKQTDKDVIKYLFGLNDNEKIESVLMFHDYGNSLCISTQIGCNMNCSFCESGRLRKVRNLEPSEMVLQILMVEEDIKKRISHIVLMGIGEPFDNYDNIMSFIRIINDNKGIDIGARHITVSTCGLIPTGPAKLFNPI
jgi:23S rRNA (adenine2503-C2)-methyltransferase